MHLTGQKFLGYANGYKERYSTQTRSMAGPKLKGMFGKSHMH